MIFDLTLNFSSLFKISATFRKSNQETIKKIYFKHIKFVIRCSAILLLFAIFVCAATVVVVVVVVAVIVLGVSLAVVIMRANVVAAATLDHAWRRNVAIS